MLNLKTRLLALCAFIMYTSATFSQGTQTFSFQGSNFQTYVVPATGWYFLDASGAQGGPSSNGTHQGGKGARVQGYVQLQAGDVLRIAVGGSGGKGSGYKLNNYYSGGGGGGASSIVKVNGSSYTPLLFAGGGGGGAKNYDGSPGLSSPNGAFSNGGINGNGAGVGPFKRGGAGGGGYYSDGGTHCDGNCSGTAPNYTNLLSRGGQAYLNGNSGGSSGSIGGAGGWGGGAQGGPAGDVFPGSSDGAGGGGGGWSGGGGGVNAGDGGGGGGSYVNASLNTSNCVAAEGVNSGDGIVSIEHLVYSNASVDTGFTFQGNVFQYFTAPATGYYQITALGASGGSVNGNSGGKGAQMQGYFLLRAGETVKIATGGAGQDGIYGSTDHPTLWTGAGGGGSSSVVLVNGTSNAPLLIAGGGGGAATGGTGIDANTTTSGSGGPSGGTGGVNGNGGDDGYQSGAGGAGYLTNGVSSDYGHGGQAYEGGNNGGTGTEGGNGGWGGGGEGASYDVGITNGTTIPPRMNGSGGGGGGYSGGGGGGNSGNSTKISYGGGGGGSYSSANCGGSNISGANTGNGSVSISGPNVAIDTVNTPGPTYTWAANGVTYQNSGTYYHVDQANCIVRVLDLSIGGLGGCLNYTRIDTTVTSCGGYTNPLNGRTYTENTTDSIRVGCTKYVVRLITTAPVMLPQAQSILATPTNSWGLIYTLGSGGNGGIGSGAGGSGGLLLSPSSPLVVCKNSTETYAIPAVPYATSYQWSLPTGATGTSSTNSITVRFSDRFSGGNICVTPLNACGTGATFCKAITVLNTPPTGRLQIVGPSAPFISGKYAVTSVPGATTYTWSVSNSQAVIVSGQGTPSIQLQAQPGFTRANLSVVASNCRGNGSRGTVALNNSGNSLPSVAWIFPKMIQPTDFSVFPNPSNGKFTLSTPSLQTDAMLEVYSVDGQMIYRKRIPANTSQSSIILPNTTAAGLYQVRLISEGGVKTMRVVKQ